MAEMTYSEMGVLCREIWGEMEAICAALNGLEDRLAGLDDTLGDDDADGMLIAETRGEVAKTRASLNSTKRTFAAYAGLLHLRP